MSYFNLISYVCSQIHRSVYEYIYLFLFPSISLPSSLPLSSSFLSVFIYLFFFRFPLLPLSTIPRFLSSSSLFFSSLLLKLSFLFIITNRAIRRKRYRFWLAFRRSNMGPNSDCPGRLLGFAAMPIGRYRVVLRIDHDHFLPCLLKVILDYQPVPMVARSKAWVCCRSLARISSNPTGSMDIYRLWVLCVVR
jgi:hypothetical protein